MAFFKDFFKGQKKFGEDISIIINTILLTIVYILGIGLTSIFAKIFGNHFLDMKLNKESESYWTELDLKKQSMEDHFRQF
jgi:uncharacterized membrane-anchored protein YhcB (DUF1043 family)